MPMLLLMFATAGFARPGSLPPPQITDLSVTYDAGDVVLTWTNLSFAGPENYSAWQSPVLITVGNLGAPPTEELTGGLPQADRDGVGFEWRFPRPYPTQLTFYAVAFQSGATTILSNNDTLFPEDAPPSAPTGLEVTANTTGTVTLTWNSATDTQYEIQILYAIGAGSTPGIPADPEWTLMADQVRTVTLPSPGTTYSIAARCRNTAGITGETSAPISAETLPLPPAPVPGGDSGGTSGGGGGGCSGLAASRAPLLLLLVAGAVIARR